MSNNEEDNINFEEMEDILDNDDLDGLIPDDSIHIDQDSQDISVSTQVKQPVRQRVVPQNVPQNVPKNNNDDKQKMLQLLKQMQLKDKQKSKFSFGSIKNMLNFNTLKLPLLVLVLFVLLSLGKSNDLLSKYLPFLKVGENDSPSMLLLLFKGVILALFVLVFQKLFKC